MTDMEIQQAAFKGPGLGLACGYRRLIEADIDTDDDNLQTLIARFLPKTPVQKRGAKGYGLFYQYETDEVPSFSLNAADGSRLIDILGHGRQTVIPPTIHPETGKPYEWTGRGKESVFSVPVSSLPLLTKAQLDALEEALRPYLHERPSWPAEDLKRKPLATGYTLSDAELKRYVGFCRTGIALRAEKIKAMAPDTGRNDATFTAACYFGKHVHHGIIPEAALIEPLLAACHEKASPRKTVHMPSWPRSEAASGCHAMTLCRSSASGNN